MATIKELLRDKRLGREWSDEAILMFVQGLVRGNVSHAQASAFLMASCIHGLSARETAVLTQSMAASGAQVDNAGLDRPCIDKHSTGGVGDKVSLLLAPLAVACGLAVPMISGRGLGHTGGTIDKLESIPGFTTALDLVTMSTMLRDHHVFMASQTPDCAPADGILYALRDVTGTVEDIGLITASILSKKIAEGISGLVMDVKAGDGAFLPDINDGRALGRSIKDVARLSGIQSTIVYSDMTIPLGRSVGNWVEVQECEEGLADFHTCEPRLRTLTTQLVAEMLVLGGICPTTDEAIRQVVDRWADGSGLREFHGMIRRQGGDMQAGHARYRQCPSIEITSSSRGILPLIPARECAIAVMRAGGGRMVETDTIDNAVGCVYLVDPHEQVVKGQPVMRVTAGTEESCARLAADLTAILERAEARGFHEPPNVIIEINRTG
jgi:pyrimidine-nucleoside phosphorylase